jgi:hypothetical protein
LKIKENIDEKDELCTLDPPFLPCATMQQTMTIGKIAIMTMQPKKKLLGQKNHTL